MQGLALQVQEGLKRDPHGGDLFIFRGRRGDLAKILWHDGIGLSLYAKRLDRGRFIWPSASDGAVSISAAQMAYRRLPNRYETDDSWINRGVASQRILSFATIHRPGLPPLRAGLDQWRSDRR